MHWRELSACWKQHNFRFAILECKCYNAHPALGFEVENLA